jgi:hypothetical protein
MTEKELQDEFDSQDLEEIKKEWENQESDSNQK